MFSIIASPNYFEEIKTVITGRGSILYGKSVNDEDVIKAFDKAGRVNASVLILDVDAGAAVDIVMGVKKFKVTRPHTRIILLAPGRKPGDSVISQLLAKGVYDILSPEIPEEGDLEIKPILEVMLEQEAATYEDVVRWDEWGK